MVTLSVGIYYAAPKSTSSKDDSEDVLKSESSSSSSQSLFSLCACSYYGYTTCMCLLKFQDYEISGVTAAWPSMVGVAVVAKIWLVEGYWYDSVLASPMPLFT